MARFTPILCLGPLLFCLMGAGKPTPLAPEQLAPGATLLFELPPAAGTSTHSNGKKPLQAQVWLPQNWDKEHAFPVWVHLGGEDGLDEKGLAYFSALFGQKNFILLSMDFPKEGHEDGLPAAVLALKYFAAKTHAKLNTDHLGLSGVTYGARAMEANAKAGGRELAAFRYRVIMGGGDLENLAQNPGPGAHWLQVGKKPLKVLDALTKAGHDCVTLETRKSALSNTYRNEIRAWFDSRFPPVRLARQRLAAAEKADSAKERARLLKPLEKEFLDFPDIQKAKQMLAQAEAQAQARQAGKKP